MTLKRYKQVPNPFSYYKGGSNTSINDDSSSNGIFGKTQNKANFGI